jgi:DNA ligase-1
VCEGPDHLQEELDIVMKNKGEGIMLRNPDSMYERVRSSNLLKVKVFEDAEATVIGTTVST